MQYILHKELQKELASQSIYDLAKKRYNNHSGKHRGCSPAQVGKAMACSLAFLKEHLPLANESTDYS